MCWTMLSKISSVMRQFHVSAGVAGLPCLAINHRQICQNILPSAPNVCRTFYLTPLGLVLSKETTVSRVHSSTATVSRVHSSTATVSRVHSSTATVSRVHSSTATVSRVHSSTATIIWRYVFSTLRVTFCSFHTIFPVFRLFINTVTFTYVIRKYHCTITISNNYIPCVQAIHNSRQKLTPPKNHGMSNCISQIQTTNTAKRIWLGTRNPLHRQCRQIPRSEWARSYLTFKETNNQKSYVSKTERPTEGYNFIL